MHQFFLQPIWILLLALSLALSSVNSKAMGLAWLLYVIVGTWAALKNRRSIYSITDNPWSKTWLFIASLALLIKGIAVLYWNDPWSERHGELRLFLGSFALYGLLKCTYLKRQILFILAYSLTISSAIGLIWVIFYGRDAVTTHPIPWAGSMAMISVFLLAISIHMDFSRLHRRLWLFGGLLALMAVLSSQSRGSYGIILWWLAFGLYQLYSRQESSYSPHFFKAKFSRQWPLLAAILIGLATLSQTPVFERPILSLQDAFSELRASRHSITEGANSSVGARLFMWQKSLIAIEKSPWIGHGHDTRKKLLLEWAEAAQSAEVKRLGHVHNEYLHQLIDHGLLGLISQLLYVGGLIFITWQLHQKKHYSAAFSVAGIAFVHMTSSLTNVNFSHNYYTASLSIFIGLSLWLARLEPAPRHSTWNLN